jgi:exportin-5
VSFCLNFILAIVRRSSTPSDVLKCKNGGFVVETTTSGGTEAGATLRSPAGNLGCHVLTTLLKLTKTFIDLFKARQNPAFSKIFDMLAVEKLTVLGGQSLTLEADNKSDNGEPAAAQLQKTNDDLTRKLQMFIYEQFENCTHILALYCSTFGHQFFKQPGLASGLVTSVYAGIEAVPDYRIRSIIRIFTKALINKCPKMCYGQVLAPVLTQLCPYMMNRLTSKWKQLIEARESPTFDEDNTDSQEVLDDVIGKLNCLFLFSKIEFVENLVA